MVNALLDQKSMPFSVKAGMIGSLEVSFGIMSLWNNTLTIKVRDLLFIVGPSVSHVSNDDSYESDNGESEYGKFFFFD